MPLSQLLTGILIQPLVGLDHELSSNAHLPGIHSAGPYSAVNPVNPLPPTRYASSTWYDDPTYGPYLATVSIHLQTSCPLC